MSAITQIDHIAIAVSSIEAVRKFYEQDLGLKITKFEELPDRGIRTAFIPINNIMIELIEPLKNNTKSEISKFLTTRGPGLHHLALKTNNIQKMQEQLTNKNQTKLIYSEPQSGAQNSKINFVHPKSTGGVLLELVQKDK